MVNKAITTALSAIGLAQALKIPFDYVRTGSWNLKTVITPGGMPSSHSAGVTSLAAFVGLEKGFHSHEFAIAALLGIIVMYDAAGVRYQAGETAIVVNELEERVEKLSEKHPELGKLRTREKELKEKLGHLPSEVIAGAVLGGIMGGIGYLLKKS